MRRVLPSLRPYPDRGPVLLHVGCAYRRHRDRSGSGCSMKGKTRNQRAVVVEPVVGTGKISSSWWSWLVVVVVDIAVAVVVVAVVLRHFLLLQVLRCPGVVRESQPRNLRLFGAVSGPPLWVGGFALVAFP